MYSDSTPNIWKGIAKNEQPTAVRSFLSAGILGVLRVAWDLHAGSAIRIYSSRDIGFYAAPDAEARVPLSVALYPRCSSRAIPLASEKVGTGRIFARSCQHLALVSALSGRCRFNAGPCCLDFGLAHAYPQVDGYPGMRTLDCRAGLGRI
jgi:hypothetical protein